MDDPSPIVNSPKKVPRRRYPKYSIEPNIENKKRCFLVRWVLDIVKSNNNSYEVEGEVLLYKIVIIPLATINPIRT